MTIADFAKPTLDALQAKNSIHLNDRSLDAEEIMDALLDAWTDHEVSTACYVEGKRTDLNPHQQEYFNSYSLSIAAEYARNIDAGYKKLSEAKSSLVHNLESELEIVKILSDTALEARWQRKALD